MMLFSANSNTYLLNVVYTIAEPIATASTKSTTITSYPLKLAYFYCILASMKDYGLFRFHYITTVARLNYLGDNRCRMVCLSSSDVNCCAVSSFATSEELDGNSVFSSKSPLTFIFNLALFDDYLRSDYYTYNFCCCLNNKTVANFEMGIQTSKKKLRWS